MKSVLYAGAALMLAAGTYGFVDYKKSNGNKEFETMYHENESPLPGAEESTEPVIVREVTPKKEKLSTKTRTQEKPSTSDQSEEIVREKTTRELSPKLFSRAPLKEVPATPGKEKISKREKTE